MGKILKTECTCTHFMLFVHMYAAITLCYPPTLGTAGYSFSFCSEDEVSIFDNSPIVIALSFDPEAMINRSVNLVVQ